MKKPTALRLEQVDVRKLKAHPQNARAHTPTQIAAIAGSLKERGWMRPLLVNEHYTVLAGHGTLQAARQNGDKIVPCIVRSGLNQAQQRSYVLADNALAERSTWDTGLLTTELLDLKGMGIDLEMTGLDADLVAKLLAPPAPQETDPPVPAPVSPAVARQGDVWVLGRHRLACGDATLPSTLEALLAGQLAQMVFTDPPYGVSYQEGKPTGRHPKRFGPIQGDDKRRGDLVQMLTSAYRTALPHTANDAAWYVWHASVTREDFDVAAKAVGLVEPANGYIIWAKPATMGWSNYKSAFEPCFYLHRQGVEPPFYGDRTETTVWRASAILLDGRIANAVGGGIILTGPAGEIFVGKPPKGKKVRHVEAASATTLLMVEDGATNVWEVGRAQEGAGKLHPTQKPVELARRAIRNSSKEGDGVLDMFAGSGSTLIAAEQTNRTAYCAELDPIHVDTIIRRWQDYAKREATHDGDGKTFDTHARQRAGRAGKAKARAPS